MKSFGTEKISQERRMKYDGVVFDLNGTLIWDTALHNRAWDSFLKRHSISLSDEEKNERIHGKPNPDILRLLFPEPLDEATISRYIGEKEAVYHRLFREIRLDFAPGARDFIGFLKERGIAHGIATSAGEENIRFYARELGLYDLFEPDTVVFNDGAVPGKPDPEIFLRTMRKLGKPPADCIVFEDSLFGIQAAERSGAGKIIIVNSEGLDYSHYPYEVITDFSQVDRALF